MKLNEMKAGDKVYCIVTCSGCIRKGRKYTVVLHDNDGINVKEIGSSYKHSESNFSLRKKR